MSKEHEQEIQGLPMINNHKTFNFSSMQRYVNLKNITFILSVYVLNGRSAKFWGVGSDGCNPIVAN